MTNDALQQATMKNALTYRTKKKQAHFRDTKTKETHTQKSPKSQMSNNKNCM